MSSSFSYYNCRFPLLCIYVSFSSFLLINSYLLSYSPTTTATPLLMSSAVLWVSIKVCAYVCARYYLPDSVPEEEEKEEEEEPYHQCSISCTGQLILCWCLFVPVHSFFLGGKRKSCFDYSGAGAQTNGSACKSSLKPLFSLHFIWAACLIWQSDCKPLWRFAAAVAVAEVGTRTKPAKPKERLQQTRALTLT